MSQEEHGDFVLMVDWRLPKTSAAPDASPSATASARTGQTAAAVANVPPVRNDTRLTVTPAIASGAPARAWNRSIYTVRGDRLTMTVNGETMLENVSYAGARRGRIALEPSGAAEFANIFIKRLD